MRQKAKLLDETAIRRAMMRISHEIIERNKGAQNLCLVGIKRRGEPLAERIRSNIVQIEGIAVPMGSMDIQFYRDDLTMLHDVPVCEKPALSFDVNGKDIVLVDDVLFTGRTARAAMEAVISCGRPSSIQLAVLIDRGHRELPIRADFVGKNIPTSKAELVEVHIPPFDAEMQVCLMEF